MTETVYTARCSQKGLFIIIREVGNHLFEKFMKQRMNVNVFHFT